MSLQCDGLDGFGRVLWDPAEAAGANATFGALLTGFAISGIIWLVSGDRAQAASDGESEPPSTEELAEKKARTQALGIIFASLIPLALSTLIYAEVSGTQDCRLANKETIVAALLLSVGAVSLILGVGGLLTWYFDDRDDTLAMWVASATLIIASTGILFGNYTARTLIQEDSWLWTREFLLQAAILLGVGVAAFLSRKRNLFKHPHTLARATLVIGTAGYLGLVAATSGQHSPELTKFVSWVRVVVWAAILPVYVVTIQNYRRAQEPKLS